MIVSESRLPRRFIGRLERGEELIGTLRQLAETERIRGAWIRAAGFFEWVELIEWDREREVWLAPRRIEGSITCTSAEGTISIRGGPLHVEMHASLSRTTDAGIQAFGGTIASARVYALDIAIDGYEDVRLERDEDTHTGLALFKGSSVRGVLAREGRSPEKKAATASSHEPTSSNAEPPASKKLETVAAAPSRVPSVPAGPISWAQAASASAEAERVAPATQGAGEESPLKRGDWIDHRQFGLCRVDGEDEDGDLRIRLPSGVRKTLKLEIFDVLPPRHEGDRRIFPLRPKTRR